MGNCFGAPSKKFDKPLNPPHSSNGFTRVPNKIDQSTAVLNTGSSTSSRKSLTVRLPVPRSEGDILSSHNLKSFTFVELKNATRNFRPDCLLGEGGFGDVYKGWINEQTLGAAKPGEGLIVAVKKLKREGFQGHKEWLSEVNHLSQLHHPNLVKLIGYCLDAEKRLLVYEFLPKGSLENHLFKKGRQPLSWAMRIKIAIGAARGLSFLHDSERQVIYRDFKASNILLDSEFNAKLSDFGLAKAGPTGDRSHVSTQVMGTQGYAAPEYIATGRLTTKCDVYSFGVVLLELLTGRRALDTLKSGKEKNLVDWARPYLGERRKLFRIMDTKLEGQYPQRGAFLVALLALNCVSDAQFRPRMAEVLAILEELQAAKPGAILSLSLKQKPPSPPSRSPVRYNTLSSTNSNPSGSPSSSSHVNSPQR